MRISDWSSDVCSSDLWAETNANPRIAARLAEHRDAFAGVPVDRGVVIHNAIDTATDHANMLGVWQKLWHDGCGKDDADGRRCRGAAVLAALQYRLRSEGNTPEPQSHMRIQYA